MRELKVFLFFVVGILTTIFVVSAATAWYLGLRGCIVCFGG